MTAEVIILNSSGVALAADSAVTIGGTKIYNTAIKLMALSKTEPVGIMVYGNAGLMGVPWETLIKIYRVALKDKQMDTLEDYAEDFLSYLKGRMDLFPPELERQWVGGNVYRLYNRLREQLIKAVEPLMQSGTPVSEEQVAKMLEELIDKQHETLGAEPYGLGMDEEFEDKARSHYSELFKELLEGVFQNLKPRKAYVTKLYDIAIYIHTRNVYSRATSGLVFAGYGNKEIYPSVANYEIEGILQGRLKYRLDESKSKKITHSRDAAVYPFAQEDMVNLFLNGVNSQILHHMTTALTGFIERVPDLIKDEDLNTEVRSVAEIKDSLGLSLEAALNSYYQGFGQHIRDVHITPVMNMVRVLPKDELAAMAEALVNLTAFKRKMTNTLETVGGPIDVAVISKGDGLVWIKRKHYFPPELNATFYKNYFRGIDND
ncbi:hypothetical protein [Leucothrix pacifica]|uniref:Uncharacterized protein n=1 Tax=Leucothrix pacifica TaxID=1247513 RepID=A0A317CJF4_9GAMM|nr:hypothetical protein [Leucothrix pacifica]PWQ96460.1 hypothetical protein DKW60_12945 [Leucothrix pacifica]